MAFRLTKEESAEIKRLTQFANRRIIALQKAYEKEGRSIIPKELSMGVQTRAQWVTDKTPISRSVKFQSEEDYKKQLRELKKLANTPNLTAYTEIQKNKTLSAIRTIMGDVPPELEDAIGEMNTPQLAAFWETFEEESRRLGLKYSSDSALETTISEFFPEDMNRLKESSLEANKGELLESYEMAQKLGGL